MNISGTFVIQVTADDPDEKRGGIGYGDVGYEIDPKSSYFDIDRRTGRITTLEELDRENIQSYEFKVN